MAGVLGRGGALLCTGLAADPPLGLWCPQGTSYVLMELASR